MKAITFITTALINLGIGAAAFFMLIISLNGFTGKQAEPGLILFIIWTLLTAVFTGLLAFMSAGFLIDKKSLHPALAALMVIVIFVVIGTISDVIGFFAAVFLTSVMR